MDIKRIMSAARRPLAMLLAMLMLFMCIGCEYGSIYDASESTDTVTSAEITDTAIDSDSGAGSECPDNSPSEPLSPLPLPETEAEAIDEHGYYYSRDDVALYIHTFGKLPPNFITKDEAEELGWEGGSVERYLEGAAIGGSKFGNREGLLPKKSGRVYYECDIDTNGGKPRGAKRIVYSNDGLIYYTDDHYESFTLLYGEE